MFVHARALYRSRLNIKYGMELMISNCAYGLHITCALYNVHTVHLYSVIKYSNTSFDNY